MAIATSSPTNVTTTSRTTGLRIVTTLQLILLAAEFLMGVVVSLFITVPSSQPGAHAPSYFSGVYQGMQWVLQSTMQPGTFSLWLHAVIGLALLLFSIILLIMSIVARRGGWITTSIFGFIGIAGAGFNGVSFINYTHGARFITYNQNVSSLLMSAGFLLAAICYVIAISALRRN